MSNYQPKEGSGALFRSDKGENPARPDYRGDIMLGGVLYEVCLLYTSDAADE